MIYLSQNDPAYRTWKLGKSKLGVGGYGCFATSLGTLFQKTLAEIMAIAGGITNDGLVVANVIAKACGGAALPPTNVPPKGWCIAVTNKYAPQGFPTHFFCVNMDTKQQIDPLDFPAQVEPLSYPIVEYRPFTGVKLVTVQTWQEEAKQFATENGIIGSGWETPDEPMSQVRVAAALKNFKDRFIP